MKIKDFIEELQKLPQNAEIWYEDSEYGPEQPEIVDYTGDQTDFCITC